MKPAVGQQRNHTVIHHGSDTYFLITQLYWQTIALKCALGFLIINGLAVLLWKVQSVLRLFVKMHWGLDVLLDFTYSPSELLHSLTWLSIPDSKFKS